MRNLFIFAVLNLVFVSSAAIAGVKPVQTREVIGLDKEYKVDVVNTSDESFLVQAWLEDLEGNKKNLPVIVTPPLFEITNNGKGIIRLTPITNRLDTKKESVFWLNIQEIPRKKATESNNVLKMAIRSRIKVFVRPDNLNMSGLEKASKDLHLSTVLVDGKKYLSASNNSPYYLSLGELSLLDGNDQYRFPDRFNMVPPFAKQTYLIPDEYKDKKIKIKYGVINDYGGLKNIHEKSL